MKKSVDLTPYSVIIVFSSFDSLDRYGLLVYIGENNGSRQYTS